MPEDSSADDYPILPRLAGVIAGAALIFPVLRVPLVFACLAGLGAMALSRPARRGSESSRATPPARRRRPRSAAAVTAASEDSFPASDPPSLTPVTGTGTRH